MRVMMVGTIGPRPDEEMPAVSGVEIVGAVERGLPLLSGISGCVSGGVPGGALAGRVAAGGGGAAGGAETGGAATGGAAGAAPATGTAMAPGSVGCAIVTPGGNAPLVCAARLRNAASPPVLAGTMMPLPASGVPAWAPLAGEQTEATRARQSPAAASTPRVCDETVRTCGSPRRRKSDQELVACRALMVEYVGSKRGRKLRIRQEKPLRAGACRGGAVAATCSVARYRRCIHTAKASQACILLASRFFLFDAAR